MRKIRIFDTTLRDGEQSPGCSMNIHEKLEMARQLERLGVDTIEAGFPIASPEDFEAVQRIAREVQSCRVAGLCRAVRGDIDCAWVALKDHPNPVLHIFLATSDIHLEHKLHKTRDEALEQVREMVAYGKSLCPNIEFSAEDASRSDRDFLVQVFDAAQMAGASVLNIPDTVGYSTPAEMQELVSYVKSHLRNPDEVILSVHCHNDLGMGVANSLAGMMGGADQIECTVNGIGERAGNAALEEIVMAIRTRAGIYGCETGIDAKQLYRSSKLLSTITGVTVPPNKAIVGANAFAHESGIHQHGVINNRETYEIISPETVGIYQNRMVLGKHSGRHAFEERLDQLGYRLPEDVLEQSFEKFKVLADRKKIVTDRDLEALISSNRYQIAETYTLESFVVNSGTVISATAVVKLIKDGESREHVARGEGPIDACFKAIDRIVKQNFPLKNYAIQSVTEGEDALGEVVVKIMRGDEIITGRGLSTDIIEASIRAYINAINKAIT
ncbi:MAG: 2-isopropylmalate synthase [Oscillospiraceae bacterium]|nr:2-isopropylmalate synthase [Oscillospiraceae bacterium]MBR6607907.1 2-isopropylmalate synthase [Oscillospiraceae bacterium]